MQQLVNMERLRKVSLEDDEFLLELLETYLADAVKQRAELAEAQRGEDLNLLADRAHRIKGGASNLGAESLASLCEQLEKSAKRGESRSDLSQAVQAEMDRVSERFRELAVGLSGRR